MDGEKVGGEFGKIGILDSTRVNQACFTPKLNKNSEQYKDMTKTEFNNHAKKKASDMRMEVAMYVGRAIYNFVQQGKEIIKIPYFFK